ncbi:TPM domain-containing protein [Desulfatirhabdium butyrativorans]|uniref:TPM domain-containing protein n=1 Tax=Desulfatirhabdium butyrativorans TaxID=340467 RepID=UPI0004160D20|nr:TPM domain-containing protein [Desulfatirhabdium butyrativorans]
MMSDPVRKFLKEAELEQIESCVRDAEQTMRGEIVVMVAAASNDYRFAGLLGAATFSIPAAIVLARIIGPLIWAGPHDLWVFLGIVLPLFFLFREIVMRLPWLKRLFIPEKEMDREVREAATIQFFSKGLHRTREETGVLIYISVLEGKVWVLGDRGVDAVAPPGFWQEIVDQVVAGIKEGRQAAAICTAVGRIRGMLAEKFPAVPGDTNELPNLIVGA